jgi:hypothetical protein
VGGWAKRPVFAARLAGRFAVAAARRLWLSSGGYTLPIRRGWRKAKAWFVHLLHLDDTTHSIAMGAAIGVFIAMTPTIGFQMLIVVFITSLVRANRIAGLPMPWITNPATIVPIYTFNYTVGRYLVGGPGLGEFRRALGRLLLYDMGLDPTDWAGYAREWLAFMGQVALPLWLGCLLVGLVCAVPAYGIMYYLIAVYRKHHRKVLAERAAAEAAAQAAAPPQGPASATSDARPHEDTHA